MKKTTNELLELEKKLYSNLKVCEKYGILERMRVSIDNLYNNDTSAYDEVKEALNPNTWDALEEAWKRWDPVPKKDVEWTGPGDMVCILKPSHSLFDECIKLNFTRCEYDEHGSPDFSAVTFPHSIVDISDLYDTLSSDNIQKRGGSRYSLQELAQERMATRLKSEIEAWATKNGCDADFYKWRDANDLVPHEDTDCRTMRLVSRDAHTAFKHRGGVANSINIRNHF